MIPPLNFSSTSSSRSGDATQGFSSAGGDFNVNYGSGVTQGGGIPGYVWLGVAVIAGLWAWKRFT